MKMELKLKELFTRILLISFSIGWRKGKYTFLQKLRSLMLIKNLHQFRMIIESFSKAILLLKILFHLAKINR